MVLNISSDVIPIIQNEVDALHINDKYFQIFVGMIFTTIVIYFLMHYLKYSTYHFHTIILYQDDIIHDNNHHFIFLSGI